MQYATGTSRGVPKWFELLPTGGIGDVPEAIPGSGLGGSATPDRAPTIKISIGSPVAALQLVWLQVRGAKDHVARVVEIPVAMQQASLGLHPCVQCRVRVRRQDMKGGGLDAIRDGPLDGSIEHIGAVVVHAEHEAAVDHDSEVVEPANRGVIIPTNILVLALISEVGGVHRLEADE